MPDVSLNGIEFSIKGSSDAASSSIDNLVDKLGGLEKSLKDVAGVKTLSDSVSKLVKALEGLKKVDLAALDRAFKAIGKSAEDLREFASISKDMAGFTRGLASLAKNAENMPDVAQGLTDIADIDFSNVVEAADGFKSMAGALRSLAAVQKASGDSLKEVADVSGAMAGEAGKYLLGDPGSKWAEDMAKTVESTDQGFLQNMREVTDTSGIDAAASAIKRFSEWIGSLRGNSDGLANAVKQLRKLAKIDFSNVGKANAGLSGLGKLAQAMSKLAGDSDQMYALESWLKSIAAIDFSNLKAAGDAITKIVVSAGAISSGGASPKEEHISAWKRLGDAIKSIPKAGLKGIGYLLVAPFKGAWKDVTKFAAGATKAVRSFKRIIGYRIVRSIIKEVGQAFGEGIKNLYGWSTMVGGRFAASMNQITTSLTYFKNSLAAAAAPIVNALAPALDFLIDKVVALINVINQLFAKLTGAATWTRAIKKAQEYDDAIAGAGGSAKEALRYLAPFDELNRLPSDNGRGGGGGSEEDYSGMFEEVTEFSEAISDFADNIRAAIERGDWQGVGTLLGEKINGLIENVNWSEIGAKIGERINAWFTGEYWTLKTINFQNIGKAIAELLTGEDGIGGALRKIDFKNIGGIIAEKLTALPKVLIGVVNNLDFKEVGKVLGDTIEGFLNGITEFIQNVDWGVTLENAIRGMFDFVKGLEIGDLAESLLTLLGSVVGAVADGLGTLLLDVAEVLISPDTWTLVGAWLQDLPAKLKNFGIKAINAFVAPLTKGINKWIETYNDSWLAEKFGKIEPITFNLIPEIPQEELTKNYDAAKATLEAKSKKNPSIIATIADYIKSSQSNLASKYKTISATAKYTSSANGLSKAERTVSTWAQYNASKTNLSNAERTVSTWAQYNSSINALSKGERTVSAWAQYNSSIDKIPEAEKTFASTAEFTVSKKGKNWTDADTTWASTALFTVSKNGPNWTPADTTWNSTALFTNKVIADSLKDQYGNIEVPVTANVGAVAGAIAGVVFNTEQANGGAFYGGAWHDISQYASGGLPRHGTAFVAGEAGPEVVGHVGGRTEVLNQSQLAATMYAAVRSALSGLSMSVSAPGVMPYADDAVSEETMYRAFSRAIADSDLGGDIELDGDVLYSAMVNRNRRNTRLTGVNAMA